jgi:cysteinyl-tRNA synthetase
MSQDSNAMANSLSYSEEKSKTLAEKMARMTIPPRDMYRRQTDLYSQFDIDGLPTHDVSGNEIKKSTLKKLMKEQEKQAKLYEHYLSIS